MKSLLLQLEEKVDWVIQDLKVQLIGHQEKKLLVKWGKNSGFGYN